MEQAKALARQFPAAPANRMRQIGAIAAVTLGVAAVAAIAMHGSQTIALGPSVSCAPRVIVVDTSSGDRSPELSGFADELIDAAADSAVVCSKSLSVLGVAGGGQHFPVITSDDLAGLSPIGPTQQIRALRFAPSQQERVAQLVTRRLRTAYEVGDPKITSMAALYDSASQQIGAGADVVLVTDGVNNDSQLNLNRPIVAGQGAVLARQIAIPSLRGTSVTIVGVAQVDSSTPPPSPAWPEEIQSFNAALCHASHAAKCRILDTASVSETLDP